MQGLAQSELRPQNRLHLNGLRRRLQRRLASWSDAPPKCWQQDNAEPTQIPFLRNCGNYLAPRTGILSGDFWTLIALYLRNIFLNVLILSLLLLALLLLPRAILWLIHPSVRDRIYQPWAAFSKQDDFPLERCRVDFGVEIEIDLTCFLPPTDPGGPPRTLLSAKFTPAQRLG